MQTPCPHPECLRPAFSVTSVKVPSRLFLKQVIERLFAFRKTFEAGSVHEEDVEPAIVVVVVEGDTTSGGFKQVFILVLAAESGDGIQSGFFGDIDERNTQVCSGSRGA